jgi:thioredoxin
MTRTARIFSVLALAAAVGGVLVARSAARSTPAAVAPGATSAAQRLPRLVDVGAGKCVACKAMLPVLEELRAEYAGRMDVRVVDAWQDPEAAEPFRVRTLPTQIFLDPDGRELARHLGFMEKAEILAQWRALGVSL